MEKSDLITFPIPLKEKLFDNEDKVLITGVYRYNDNMNFTTSILKQKQKQGLIRGFRITSASKKGERKRFLKKVGKQKYWMEIVLQEWCKKNAYQLIPEFQFLLNRKFRFDWAVPAIKVAIEYEGIYSPKSRHTTKQGYSRDSEKYTAAAVGGWRVLRYTADNYKNLKNDLECLSFGVT